MSTPMLAPPGWMGSAQPPEANFRIDRPADHRHLGPMFAAFLLLFVVVVYRIVSGFAGFNDYQWLHNFAPMAAVALCGAVYLPRRVAVALPLAALLISDVVLNVFCYHQPLLTWEIVPHYFALALIAALGFSLRMRAKLGSMLAASLASSVLFYVITNTGSWIGQPEYAKTFAGWMQALTTGVPGYPSTWWFSRHTLVSDLVFTGLFYVCMAVTARPPSALAAEPAVLVS